MVSKEPEYFCLKFQRFLYKNSVVLQTSVVVLPASSKRRRKCISQYAAWRVISDFILWLCVLLSGYLSCCRFLDDNQIVTSSGDTTW